VCVCVCVFVRKSVWREGLVHLNTTFSSEFDVHACLELVSTCTCVRVFVYVFVCVLEYVF